MSDSMNEASSFFAPLKGRTATFLIEDRQTNLDFARTVMGLLAQTSDAAEILDLDAFYASNSNLIFAPVGSLANVTLSVPEPGAVVETEFAKLFECYQGIIIVDSLNSFYHLISQEDGSSRNRKLNFAIASLGYLARTNGKAVIFPMYRRESLARGGNARAISGLSDITASVNTRRQELLVKVERGPGWEGGVFSTRIPSGEPYRFP